MRTITPHPRRRRLDSENGPARRSPKGEGGFTLVEFMVSALIMSIVLGGTVGLATQIQRSYGTQLDDANLEQEARYALDWIARDLRAAGSDPYDITLDALEVWLDPNGGGDSDSIRIQSDINPPDGVLDGDGENVTIALDPVNQVITRADANADVPGAVAMTDDIFLELIFTYLDEDRVETDQPELVTYVRVQVTTQSRVPIPNMTPLTYPTSTLATEVRLRTR
jgi:Tfp pilus assembly protein PilW